MIRYTTMTALLIAMASPAFAKDKPFSEVGGWAILKDGLRANNCFAEATYPEGVLVRMGFLDGAKKGFIAMFNTEWTQFKSSESYDVAFTVDGKGFEGMELDEVYGRVVGDFHGTEIVFKDPIYLELLADGNSLTFMSEGSEMATVGLEGSAAALEQVVACQATK